MAGYVESRRIGEATVTVIHDATNRWNPHWQAPEAEWRRAIPEADSAGEIQFDTSVFHIAMGDASVVVDLGFGEAPERYRTRSPLRRSPGVLSGLATIGLGPDDITHVVITHAHGDHIMGATAERDGAVVARFPRARHLIGRTEWERNPARDRPGSPEAEELGALDRMGLLDLVDGDRVVAPGILMVHAPGESPGHSIVRVRSAGETFYCLGDLFHHPCEVAHLDWLPAERDAAATRVSRGRLVAEAVPGRFMLAFSHAAFPCWGRVSPAGVGYRWERC
jgi:glyoxylase-like metal-dependent hydrolase (beta-lactamase superfamily II)